MTASHTINSLIVVAFIVALAAVGCAPGIRDLADVSEVGPRDASNALEDAPDAYVALQDANTPADASGNVGRDSGVPCAPHGVFHNDHCDCNRGYRAEGLTCVAIEACPADDLHEPNNSVTTATRLTVGADLIGRRCAEDVDYFVLRAPMGQRLVVDLLFRHGDGDLDLLLYEPGRDPRVDRAIARSESSDNDEQVAHRTRTEGDFIVVVTGGATSAQARYTIRARIDP